MYFVTFCARQVLTAIVTPCLLLQGFFFFLIWHQIIWVCTSMFFFFFTKKLNTNNSILKFSVVYMKECSSTKGSVAYIDNWVRLKKVRMLPSSYMPTKRRKFLWRVPFLDWVQLKKVRTNFFQCFDLREPTLLNTVFISQLDLSTYYPKSLLQNLYQINSYC